jgi:hypothetical protein
MKIALCISGLAAKGKQGNKAFITGFENIKNKILNKYDVDVFLYSCEPELEETLKTMYAPKKSLFETQKDFSLFFRALPHSLQQDSVTNYQGLYNMLYGRYKVGLLKTEFEKINNFCYDWVIFSRYDVGSANHIVSLIFDADLDNQFIYSPFFSQINVGMLDMWFYSNSNNMDYILNLYLSLSEYLKIDGKYVECATTSWYNSNINDRFSCEMFLGDHSTQTTNEIIPHVYLCNPHLLYKWHLMQKNLWNLQNLKFIATNSNPCWIRVKSNAYLSNAINNSGNIIIMPET